MSTTLSSSSSTSSSTTTKPSVYVPPSDDLGPDNWGSERWAAGIVPPLVAGIGLLALWHVHLISAENKRKAATEPHVEAARTHTVVKPPAGRKTGMNGGREAQELTSVSNPVFDADAVDNQAAQTTERLRQVKSLPTRTNPLAMQAADGLAEVVVAGENVDPSVQL